MWIINVILSPPFRKMTLLGMVCFTFTAQSWAQDRDTTQVDPDVESVLEDANDAEGIQEGLLEILTELQENPLEINSASAADFAQIPYLGAVLAQAIVSYRDVNGPFSSIPELRNVPGLSAEILLNIRPYITIGEVLETRRKTPPKYPLVPSFQTITQGMRYDIIQRASRRLDLGPGYDPEKTGTRYLGSPYRMVTRFKATYRRNVSIALTADKDPGEAFQWDPNQKILGYDFLAGHVAIRNMGRIRSLVIGDFVTAFGQGVAQWRGSGFGKGTETTRSIIRRGGGVLPYSSTDENRFFRGVGATIALSPTLNLSAFGSIRDRDASVVPDSLSDEEREVFSIYDTGYHRTESELEKKGTLNEKTLGGALEWKYKKGMVGATGYYVLFDQPFATKDNAYQYFAFTGKETTQFSLYFNQTIGKIYGFGELSRDGDGTFGGLGGIFFRMSPGVETLVLARNFAPQFNSLYGYAFGERAGETNNEKGIYTGLKIRLNRNWTASAYFDQFEFPWLRYNIYRPTKGYEALVKVDYQPRRWLRSYVQFKTETKEEATKIGIGRNQLLPGVAPQNRQTARLHLEYDFSKTLRTRTRLDVSHYQFDQQPSAFGFLMYQDARWIVTPKVQMDVRFAVFQTDNYDARVYSFENDALYVLSNPSFSGIGQRAYVLLKCSPLSGIDLWLKYGATRYEHRKTVSSGLDEVEGNRLRDVNVQIRWRF
ncbi:MAG: helix-hairpin-helix domain-containing protein [Bacteroidetes Order II. Incertae sedis bacterium]|nr:helix-hairpin-helix domain-containing protein [Bacteroidetes Order II. bacterium]